MITKYPGKITKNLPAGPVRGSMTAQDLTRLNRDVIGEIREMHPLLTPKLTNVTIYHAVGFYIAGGVRKQRIVTVAKYGEIRCTRRRWYRSNRPSR